MDTGSSKYIVHKTFDPLPDYNLVLLQQNDEYCVLYGYVMEELSDVPSRLWHDIDVLAKHATWYSISTFSSFIEMGKFIRGYVGEARWILAILETM